MNITVSVDFDNTSFENFSKLETFCFDKAMEFGREMMKKLLEYKDKELMESRDVKRYRAKGYQKTCIKTKLGDTEYRRRTYIDNAVPEGIHCVHLLDEALGFEKIGMYSPGVVQLMTKNITVASYRGTSDMISQSTGLKPSFQAVWNVIQKVGESQMETTERFADLAAANHGPGVIETDILYEENDGVYLGMQGKDRPEMGSSREMKVGIAYDGVIWKKGKNGKKRRILDNKVAYAAIDKAKEFRRKKEGIVASRFNTNSIKTRVCNGDGAGWVQKFEGKDRIITLDAFHRNKKIRECVKDQNAANLLLNMLYKNEHEVMFDCILALMNEENDEKEKEKLQELYNYFWENKDFLSGYYNRGIEIPPTRDPGNIHHARLGSMESNIFTLIANRMKGKRRNWSIKGANHLASILCAKHTTGLDNLFSAIEEFPEFKNELTDEEQAFIDAPIPRKLNIFDGKGYEPPHNICTTNSGYPFLSEISLFTALSDMKF